MMEAVEAEQVLNNEQFKRTLQSIKDHLLNAWLATELKDVAGREEIHRRYKAALTIEGILRTTMESGILASQEVEKQSMLKTAVNRVREFWNG